MIDGSKKYMTVVHGKATDELAPMIGRVPDRTTGSGRAYIIANDVTLSLDNYKFLSGCFTVSTHKLLMAALTAFTTNNHIGLDNQQPVKETAVYISFNEYATACGYDVYPREDESPEQAQKRTKVQKRKARQKINKDLDILYAASLEWCENVGHGKNDDYLSTRLISQKGFLNGHIKIVFTAEFAEYLHKRMLTQYPYALYTLDERNANAYKMGYKMSIYYMNDTNIRCGRNDRLKVQTLLSVCDLPDIDTVIRHRNSWRDRIRKPFERALNHLVDCGLLRNWYYKEDNSFNDFIEWSKTTVTFELADAPDPTDRMKGKADRR